MRPTRRGWTVVGLAVSAVLMAWVFGSRSLNAVTVTAGVALAVGAVQLHLAETPDVARSTVQAGYPGDRRTVTLSLEGTPGTIVAGRDDLPAGVDADDPSFEGALPLETSYEATLAGRGRQHLGPVTVRLRDAMGLVVRTEECGATSSVLVYPRVLDVSGSETLSAIVERAQTPEREAIDRLREYVPGDPLRDVAWKQSAKRPGEFVVVEFAGEEATGTVEIAASANVEGIDRAASAVASVALFLLAAGLEVGITVPGGRVEPAVGPRHRLEVLRTLAETGPGTVDQGAWNDADLRVVAEGDAVTVDTGVRTMAFDVLRAGEDARLRMADSDDANPGEVSAP